MSNTGVQVSEGAIDAFTSFKLKRRPVKTFLTFKLNDAKTQVVLDQEGNATSTFDDFVQALVADADGCRYGVFIVSYESAEGGREKTGFFVWCPETAKVREKMLYAGTKDTVKRLSKEFNLKSKLMKSMILTFKMYWINVTNNSFKILNFLLIKDRKSVV